MRVATESELIEPRTDPTCILNEVISAVDRMESAIADLIALQREARPANTMVEVGQLIDGAADRWRATAADRGRSIIVTRCDRPALFSVRGIAIDTALDVLLDNAIVEATGAGDGTLGSVCGGR